MSSTTELLNAVTNHTAYTGSVKSRVDDILDSILNNTEYKNGSRSDLENALIELKQVISTGGFGFNMANWKYTRFNSKSFGVKKNPSSGGGLTWTWFCILDASDVAAINYVNLTLTRSSDSGYQTYKLTRVYKNINNGDTTESLNLYGTDQSFVAYSLRDVPEDIEITAEWEFF